MSNSQLLVEEVTIQYWQNGKVKPRKWGTTGIPATQKTEEGGLLV
jgi:hypothetical protein